jgi:CofD-related protein of GAK system/HprK-related kinase B
MSNSSQSAVNGNRSVQKLASEYAESASTDKKIGLRFGNCKITLNSNSNEIIRELKEYYKSFLYSGNDIDIEITAIDTEPPELGISYTIKTPDPGKTKIKEEYADLPDGRVVRKRLTGMVFLFGNGLNLAVGPAYENVNQVINFINNRYIEWLLKKDGLLCHAAGVSLNGCGMAMAGFSGMGKSTLALHMMSSNLKFVSNDRLILKRHNGCLTMYGVAKHPRVNPGTLLNNNQLRGIIDPEEYDALRKMTEEELWKLEQKHDVLIEDVFGYDRLNLETELKAFVILNWQRDGSRTEMHSVDINERRDLLKALMKAPGLFYLPDNTEARTEFSEEDYVSILSGCPIYEISGGINFDMATHFCLDILKEHSTDEDRLPEVRSENYTKNITISKSVTLPDHLKLARFRKSPELGPKLLFFSGGTALNPLSRKMTEYTHNSIHLLTPFDSGGSSAKLRDAFDMLSIGDMRSRLMALADQTISGHPEIYKLFSFRFPKDSDNEDLKRWLNAMAEGGDSRVSIIPDPMRKIIRHHLQYFISAMPTDFDLRGASVGNLILAGGYLNHNRHLDPVLFMFSKLVEVKGTVRTVTGENLHLIAELENGEIIRGQRDLTGKEVEPIKSSVTDLYLTDDLASACPIEVPIRQKIRELIDKAELICYPMGSFYSSIVANLLPEGVSDAIAENLCPKVYIPSTGNDPELYGVSLAQSVLQLLYYIKRGCKTLVSTDRLLNFVIIDKENGRYPEPLELESINRLGVEIINANIVTEKSSPYIDEDKLIEVLLSLT